MSLRVAIFNRLIKPVVDGLSPEAAESLLRADFPESDHTRMAELSSKAQEARLSPEERSELDEYILTADFLAILQSHARQSLRRVKQAS
jgi:hypothetical protein